MYTWFRLQLRCSTLLFVIGMATSAFADEGMWLFNAPPLKQLKEKYQFEPTPQWLEHLQKASVRFNSGGSGSFVSANGLVITNHQAHVVVALVSVKVVRPALIQRDDVRSEPGLIFAEDRRCAAQLLQTFGSPFLPFAYDYPRSPFDVWKPD
jgi:hypothetical protein